MRLSYVVAAVLCVLALRNAPLGAVETKTWEQSAMADYDKGTIAHLSVSSDGRLTLAPALKELADPSVTFLWAVARDSKGNIYAGGGGFGGKAKLLAIDTQGRSKTLAELEGLAVQAIAIDRQDRVYAATSPDGKVFRIDAAGKAEVFYDPKAKYIWSIAFAPNGDLFVATGDTGEIHRVTPSTNGPGTGSVFFRTEETHVRSLTVDASGNVIAGTDPSGLILRVSPTGAGFVLYQSPKREITAVAVAPDGIIYAAGTGNKQAAAPAPGAAFPPITATNPATPAGVIQVTARPAQPVPPTLLPLPVVTGGSELYRIQADGYPHKIWSHAQDLIYALAFDAQGRVLAGAGNHGTLYRIDNDHAYTRLLNVEPTQITGLVSSPSGTLYAVTGNIGKVFAIGPGTESSGTFESEAMDASAFSYWGRLSHEPKSDAGLVFETRSGNVNRAQNNWSPWARTNAGRIASPGARFLQYRVTLTGAAAQLDDVELAYQTKNVAPVIDELEITPDNYRFPAPAANNAAANPPLTLPPLGRKSTSSGSSAGDSGNTPALNWAKGFLGARWLANDENGDALAFTVEIRGKNETGWKPVRDKVREHYVSWDSSAFPDGEYVLRVTASDAPSNPPADALRSLLESDPFVIDNTPPEITGLGATLAGGKLDVRFHVKDALSVLGKAEYSVNGGDWIVVEPTTRLTDSTEHDYHTEIEKPAGEATIAVRVEDERSNQAVAKVVVR